MVCMLAMEFCLITNPQEGETFVTRKITMALSKIHVGLEKCLFIGNLDAKRDWGACKRLC